ncbi:DUF2817 domain-containing protein [Corallincola spongiicola]|uniref:DUF2817 domain-containing protein n=1 Tax=Corallincola spongiicola TaxID=2520508 RepID=A0ABY1WUM2_9GAMM|nr:DUF2817 domain-containing protein [Corallincola spongiicola]TAA48276.1 DUF2817 domain-containing protein [Corallincola spongiicola]
MRSDFLYELNKHLPELFELQQLIDRADNQIKSRVLTQVKCGSHTLPVYQLTLGSEDPTAPALVLLGGVHGVERIGTQVLLAFLRSLLERLRWDKGLNAQLQQMTLIFVPLVNPGGMWMRRRCNPNGIDLMRNAPIESAERVLFLAGGHRLSRHLPWYRGKANQPMESEINAVYQLVKTQLLQRPFCLSLDCHSGFGLTDRVWFPYARTRQPIADLAVAYRLSRLFNKAHRHNTNYLFEPQSSSYTTHGDVWDLLYDESRQTHPKHTFLPLTLEMGSWLWVKKNPRQLLRFVDLFNPTVPHRQNRVLRRHYALIDFLMAATRSYAEWLPQTAKQQRKDFNAGLKNWYSHSRKGNK